jgi:hypothetical protein
MEYEGNEKMNSAISRNAPVPDDVRSRFVRRNPHQSAHAAIDTKTPIFFFASKRPEPTKHGREANMNRICSLLDGLANAGPTPSQVSSKYMAPTNGHNVKKPITSCISAATVKWLYGSCHLPSLLSCIRVISDVCLQVRKAGSRVKNNMMF